jgi:cytochrome P450
MERVIEPYIEKAMSLNEGADAGHDKQDFISSLARETNDRKHIRDAIMAMLLAGRDTTAGTLSWCFLELARHPEVLQKLRKEVDETLATEGPSYQQLKDMKYLSAVINETTRLYPALSWNFKHALQDTTLPEGGGPNGKLPVGVPKGTLVSICPLSMHRRGDLYPEGAPDPNLWCPDRWDNWHPEAWHVIPFSGGPRVCLGQNFALTEMSYLVARFVQSFGQFTDCGNKAVFQANMLLTPAEGVRVKVSGTT